MIAVGVFLFSFLCVLGSSTFAASLFLKGTAAMFPLMLLGRLLFGSGNGSLTSKWDLYYTLALVCKTVNTSVPPSSPLFGTLLSADYTHTG